MIYISPRPYKQLQSHINVCVCVCACAFMHAFTPAHLVSIPVCLCILTFQSSFNQTWFWVPIFHRTTTFEVIGCPPWLRLGPCPIKLADGLGWPNQVHWDNRIIGRRGPQEQTGDLICFHPSSPPTFIFHYLSFLTLSITLFCHSFVTLHPSLSFTTQRGTN